MAKNKRKVLGFSTLVAVVAVAMTFCFISENSNKTDMSYEETSSIDTKSNAKGSISEEKLTDNKKVVDDDNVKEVTEMVEATPEPTKEPTQASLLGFEPIEGQEIPGIDYKEYIKTKTNKDINLYLYSIIDGRYEKIE